jgi:hypothetical protein
LISRKRYCVLECNSLFSYVQAPREALLELKVVQLSIEIAEISMGKFAPPSLRECRDRQRLRLAKKAR